MNRTARQLAGWRTAGPAALLGAQLLAAAPEARVAPATLDAGGQRITAGSLTIDGSLGGVAGISAGAGGTAVAKHGFAGQLVDLASIAIDASPTQVAEGATSQLSATGVYDDDTRGELAADPAWGVLSGPISAVDATGLATAGRVYTNTAAWVAAALDGVSGSRALRVVNTNADDYGMYAADGLDDAWQVEWFGEDNPDAAPGADPDEDLRVNRHERMAGTDPTSPASHFALAIRTVPGKPDCMDLLLAPVFPDRTYRVERTVAVTPAEWGGLSVSTQGAAGSDGWVRDLAATNPAAYYRVRIGYPAP